MNRRNPIPRFDRAAASYEGAARVQGEFADELIRFLDGHPAPETALDAGCGSGQLTERLRRLYPDCRIDAFDASLRMVAEAKRRLAGDPRLSVFTADMRRLRRTGRYDLVVSSSALHWLQPMAPALRRLAAALRPDGRLAAAVMTEGTLGELHDTRNRIAPHKRPSALPSVPEIETALTDAGFRILQTKICSRTTRHASPEALLNTLRAMGVTGGRFSQGPAPLTREELRELARSYGARYREPDGTIRATWKAALLLAGT